MKLGGLELNDLLPAWEGNWPMDMDRIETITAGTKDLSHSWDPPYLWI
jgi:hypothetical protein